MISSSDILHAKVLIVDNEEVSVLLLERLLRGAGYVSLLETRIAPTFRYAAGIILRRRSFPCFGREFDSHRPLQN